MWLAKDILPSNILPICLCLSALTTGLLLNSHNGWFMDSFFVENFIQRLVSWDQGWRAYAIDSPRVWWRQGHDSYPLQLCLCHKWSWKAKCHLQGALCRTGSKVSSWIIDAHKKKSGPCLEPCATPPNTELHCDVLLMWWCFKTVRCFLLSRELRIRDRSAPKRHNCLVCKLDLHAKICQVFFMYQGKLIGHLRAIAIKGRQYHIEHWKLLVYGRDIRTETKLV